MRWLSVVVAVVVATQTAAAEPKPKDKNPFIFSPDNYFVETHYELGYQSMSDVSFGGGLASGGGLHLTEHNGLISRLPYVVIFMFAALQAGGDVKLKGSYSETPTESEYVTRDSKGREIDRTKISGTSRSISATVVPLTEEEKRLRDEHLGRISAQLGVLALIPTHFDIMYLPNRDDGRLRGIRMALYPLAIGIGRHFQIGAGYAGARFKAEYMDEASGQMRTMKYRLRSLAGRIGFAPFRFLVLSAEVQPNFVDGYAMTLRGTAAVSIPRLERLYGKIGAEKMGGEWNTFFEAGLRF